MSETAFNLFFDGKIIEGYTTDQVKANLARLFKKDLQTIEKLFLGKPVLIKKALPRAVALKYKKAFVNAGAKCRFVPISPTAKVQSQKQKAPSDKQQKAKPHIEQASQPETGPIKEQSPVHQASNTQSPEKQPAIEKPTVEKTTPPADSGFKPAMIVCPNCGAHQNETESCFVCGKPVNSDVPDTDDVSHQAENYFEKFKHSKNLQIAAMVTISLIILSTIVIAKFVGRSDFSYVYKNELPQFSSLERIDRVDAQWDFSNSESHEYYYAQKMENIIEVEGAGLGDMGNVKPTQTMMGHMTVQGNGDNTGKIVLEDLMMKMTFPGSKKRYGMKDMEEQEMPSAFCSISDHGALIDESQANTYMIAQLFRLPHLPISNGESCKIPKADLVRLCNMENPSRSSGKITLNRYVFIEGHVCAELTVQYTAMQNIVTPMMQGRTTQRLKGFGTLYYDVDAKRLILARVNHQMMMDMDAQVQVPAEARAFGFGGSGRIKSSMGSESKMTIVLKDYADLMKNASSGYST